MRIKEHFSVGGEEKAARGNATYRGTRSTLMDFLVMTFCILDGFGR